MLARLGATGPAARRPTVIRQTYARRRPRALRRLRGARIRLAQLETAPADRIYRVSRRQRAPLNRSSVLGNLTFDLVQPGLGGHVRRGAPVAARRERSAD